MKEPIQALVCCLLICLLCQACNSPVDPIEPCEPATHYFSNQNNFIPYAEGSAFQLHDSTGRIVHFVDSLYKNESTGGGSSSCQCCDVNIAQTVRTAFRSDSTRFFIEIRESAASSNGASAPDYFSVSIDAYNFYGTISSDAIISANGTAVIAHPTLTLGSQTFSNVYEMSNGLSLPVIGANKVWYHKTSGLLKIAFTDGSILEI